MQLLRSSGIFQQPKGQIRVWYVGAFALLTSPGEVVALRNEYS
jgi:hypothetical protein